MGAMDQDRPGLVIAGKYELQEATGKGGMATVWRATSRGAAGFERPVAVKRILPALVSNADFLAMFIEEARVGSKLIHLHIVQIIDFGTDRVGTYFLVMEWVEGLTFGRWLRAYHLQREHPPWTLVVAVMIEALRGLTAAHEREEAPVYHRDITPQNILVGNNGIAKLSDFGLSRAMDRARMTRPDIVKGKVSYLAPELTMGGPPGVQTDLYGAGIVLWEALAGRQLYDGDTDIQVLLKVREGKVDPPLETLRPDVPSAVHEAVNRALAKDPGDRFESAHQMARTLARILRTVPEDTDAKVIAQSMGKACRWLAEAIAAASAQRS